MEMGFNTDDINAAIGRCGMLLNKKLSYLNSIFSNQLNAPFKYAIYEIELFLSHNETQIFNILCLVVWNHKSIAI